MKDILSELVNIMIYAILTSLCEHCCLGYRRREDTRLLKLEHLAEGELEKLKEILKRHMEQEKCCCG
jgi:hypothetical protein